MINDTVSQSHRYCLVMYVIVVAPIRRWDFKVISARIDTRSFASKFDKRLVHQEYFCITDNSIVPWQHVDVDHQKGQLVYVQEFSTKHQQLLNTFCQ